MHTVAVVKEGVLETLKEEDFESFFRALPRMGELPVSFVGGGLLTSREVTNNHRLLVDVLLTIRPRDANVEYILKRLAMYLRFMKGSEQAVANTVISVMKSIFIWVELRTNDNRRKVLAAFEKHVLSGFARWPEWGAYRGMDLCRYAIIGLSVSYQEAISKKTHHDLDESLSFLDGFRIESEDRAALAVYLLIYYPTQLVGWLLKLIYSLQDDDARNALVNIMERKIASLNLTLYQSAKVHNRKYTYPTDADDNQRASIRFYSAVMLVTATTEQIQEACRAIRSRDGAESLMSILSMTPMDILSTPKLPDAAKRIVLGLTAR